jgi:hypothetical protein
LKRNAATRRVQFVISLMGDQEPANFVLPLAQPVK